MPTSPFLQPPPITLLETILKPLKVSLEFLPTEVTKERLKSYVWTEDVLSELIPYYIPCMIPRFFENDYPINTVTIIRHILKEYDIKIVAKEGTVDYKKNTVYHISRNTKDILDEEIVLRFE